MLNKVTELSEKIMLNKIGRIIISITMLVGLWSFVSTILYDLYFGSIEVRVDLIEQRNFFLTMMLVNICTLISNINLYPRYIKLFRDPNYSERLFRIF